MIYFPYSTKYSNICIEPWSIIFLKSSFFFFSNFTRNTRQFSITLLMYWDLILFSYEIDDWLENWTSIPLRDNQSIPYFFYFSFHLTTIQKAIEERNTLYEFSGSKNGVHFWKSMHGKYLLIWINFLLDNSICAEIIM